MALTVNTGLSDAILARYGKFVCGIPGGAEILLLQPTAEPPAPAQTIVRLAETVWNLQSLVEQNTILNLHLNLSFLQRLVSAAAAPGIETMTRVLQLRERLSSERLPGISAGGRTGRDFFVPAARESWSPELREKAGEFSPIRTDSIQADPIRALPADRPPTQARTEAAMPASPGGLLAGGRAEREMAFPHETQIRTLLRLVDAASRNPAAGRPFFASKPAEPASRRRSGTYPPDLGGVFAPPQKSGSGETGIASALLPFLPKEGTFPPRQDFVPSPGALPRRSSDVNRKEPSPEQAARPVPPLAQRRSPEAQARPDPALSAEIPPASRQMPLPFLPAPPTLPQNGSVVPAPMQTYRSVPQREQTTPMQTRRTFPRMEPATAALRESGPEARPPAAPFPVQRKLLSDSPAADAFPLRTPSRTASPAAEFPAAVPIEPLHFPARPSDFADVSMLARRSWEMSPVLSGLAQAVSPLFAHPTPQPGPIRAIQPTDFPQREQAAPAFAPQPGFTAAPVVLRAEAPAPRPAATPGETLDIPTVHTRRTVTEETEQIVNRAINAPGADVPAAAGQRLSQAVEEAVRHMDVKKLSERVYTELETRLRLENTRRGKW